MFVTLGSGGDALCINRDVVCAAWPAGDRTEIQVREPRDTRVYIVNESFASVVAKLGAKVPMTPAQVEAFGRCYDPQ